MKWVALVLLFACGRESSDVAVNAFKGSWTGVAYAAALTDLYTARVTFEDTRFTWRINKQPGLNDFLVAEGNYQRNESGFLIMTVDRARYETSAGDESLARQGNCFATADATCIIDVQQSSQYLVSGQNVQFSLQVGSTTVVTNANRDL